jgi:putative PIN family toxin of toxin-antitoxin system
MRQESKCYKVVIDTNLWVSFLIGKTLKGLQRYIYNEKIRIITCKEQIFELKYVFDKPKLKRYFSDEQITEFFDLFDDFAQLQKIENLQKICRDPKDDFLLSLAIESRADFLVTGDLDLLIIGKIGETNIVNYADFEKIIFL